MSRRYRRSRRSSGLIELAATSDWRLAAGLSAAFIVASIVFIPALLGGNRFLGGLVTVFSPLAGLMAAIFGVIALFRLLNQGTAGRSVSEVRPDAERREPSVLASSESVSARDKELLAGTLQTSVADASPERPAVWSRDVIDRIEWKRFEDLCCEFYRIKGIHAATTSLGADGGVDIRLFQDESDPQRCTAVVQCKAWNRLVGVKEIRELRGVMAHEKVEKAFFMAPKGFTDEAKVFAVRNRINLLDGRRFLAMLKRLPEIQRQALLSFATAGGWTVPSCPTCGLKMVERNGKRGRFWGCVRYPACRGSLPMRTTAT